MPALNPVNVFYCYAPQDEELRSELEKHLSVLRRQGYVRSFSAQAIGAGEEWRAAIDRHLDEAEVILLLVSADLLASDYLYEVELARALERRRGDGAEVLAILLRPGDYAFRDPPLRDVTKVLPQNEVPVTSWPTHDAAFADVVQGLRLTLEKIGRATTGRRPTNPLMAHFPRASGRWARARRRVKDRSLRSPQSGTCRTGGTPRSRGATRS
jgi:TIR domain